MIDQLQHPLTASIEEVLADEWGSFVCETFQTLIDDLKAKMPMILQKAQEKVDTRRRSGTCEVNEDSTSTPAAKSPRDGKGKRKATARDSSSACELSRPSDHNTMRVFTAGSNNLSLSGPVEMYEPIVQGHSFPQLYGLPYPGHEMVDPPIHRPMGFELSPPANHLFLDNSYGGCASQ